ncbi:MAG: hypothetical protein V4679_18085 [Pseudomonadota bacterium]
MTEPIDPNDPLEITQPADLTESADTTQPAGLGDSAEPAEPDQDAPPEVVRLIAALTAIPGVTQAQLDNTYLPEVAVSDLSLPGPYADLPIAALRRSNGALENELLLSLEFRIQRNEAGLRAAEFLSWWVRDQSRGGENMQIRTIGQPPMVAGEQQLGRTLRFTIDWFYADTSEDTANVLSAVGGKALALELATNMYKDAF